MEGIKKLLFEASVEGNVTTLLTLLQEDPLILDRVTLNLYNDTPLHVASMLGHVDFVKEILARKPELAMEFNSQRYLPLHLAATKGHLETVKVLVSANPDTCLVCDRDGRNPLHLAAIRGREDVLEELVKLAPHAARAMVHQDETVLHLCVRHNQLEALKFLMETVGDHDFVNSKDADGNTVLHLAVADKQIEAINFLVLNTSIEVNALNVNGETAMDILAQSRRDKKDIQIAQSLLRAGAFEAKTESSLRHVPKSARRGMVFASFEHNDKPPAVPKDLKNLDDWLEKKRNTLMVVASLIATMAFQAGVNPPGGVWQDDLAADPQANPAKQPHQAGYAVMSYKHPDLYNRFLVCNTVGFVSSLSITLLLISGLPFLKRRVFMWILMVIMWTATTAMSLTYLVSISVVTATHQAKTYKRVVNGIILVWIGLVSLLLLGHTIRLVVRATRKFSELAFARKRRLPSSVVANHNGI